MECSKNNICFNFPKECEKCGAISDMYNHYPCLKNKDVVEVVRCCECKKHKKHTDVVGYCSEHNIAVVYSDFCSYGERRTDNDL